VATAYLLKNITLKLVVCFMGHTYTKWFLFRWSRLFSYPIYFHAGNYDYIV